MKFATLLPLVLQYGPSIIPIIQNLVAAIKSGKGDTEVSDADWAELTRLSQLSAESIYARLGIELPPAK